MNAHDPSCWDYRSLSIRARSGSEGPELGLGAVEQLLRTVQDMEHLEEKGWRLVRIACQEDEPGLQRYQVVLKRPRAGIATGESAETLSHAAGVKDVGARCAQPSIDADRHSSRRRAA